MKWAPCGTSIGTAWALVATALAVGTTGAAAATPWATPTEVAAPPATPVPGTYIDIHVVNDLNGDGVRQPGEPGVSGALLHVGCGDAFGTIPATDGEGNTRIRISSNNGRVQECITLDHRFGWLATTNPELRFDFPIGDSQTALFLVRDLGPDVMEVYGEPILAGVPATDARIALAAPYADCIERAVGRPYPLLFIVGATRSGCPPAGSPVQLLLDGSPAGILAYAPGRVTRDLVARGDSMRMYGSFITAARIGDVDCAVVQLIAGGFMPPGAVRVFVLSEEVRAGCGAPGRPVRFYRGDTPLDPTVPWRAGRLEYPDVPDFAPVRVIASPDTGGGGDSPPSDKRSLTLAVVLMALGVSAAAAGCCLARTRSAA